ncbi:PQQ-binding-like beta-propeller repeat protein [Candidatus Rariloculus sp.]|uniref:outer membrane protein assembly factor BamB family protein n=1 Tax=Candidatus Rariloculus sp. TaxID=3101265 RepID=UPI003D11A272
MKRSAAVMAWSGVYATLAMLVALPGLAQQTAPAFAGVTLVESQTTNWPTNGGNWYNQRYSPLTEINRDNVANLKGVWRARLGGSGVGAQYSGEAQPIVYEGVIYIVTGADDVFAIDIDSGESLWSYEANLEASIGTICCGWTSRGVGLGDGKVYVGQLDGQIKALDQLTGEVVWATQAERWQEGFSITSAPLYYDGLVITGFAGAEFGVRGRVKAYDAANGELVWTFYTIPGPGHVGHETWPDDNDIWMHGGATVWQTPALDPELGLIYFSTGNPGPDFNGSVREGDNLFSASIVAVDARTGEYRWHFQQVRHDIWDYDGPSPVVLFDIEIDGVVRKGLAEPSKTGWVYILDRTNGEPLIGMEERAVPQEPRQATAATQPYPIGDSFVPHSVDIAPEGYRLTNGGRIFTPYWTDEDVIAKPAVSGGANWPPSSYDPASGYLYVCGEDRVGVFRAEEVSEERPRDGERYTGGIFGAVPLPNLGVFAAMDMRTNTIAWRQHWPEPCYSGSAATAGGLVFVGRSDGRLTALDSSNGALLWEFQTGAGMNAPVAVFEHDGTQYVAAYSAGNLFAGSVKGDSLWLFALEGDLDAVEPGGTLMSFPADLEGEADLANGQAVYELACVACHGTEGEGGHGGGIDIRESTQVGAVIQVVHEGRNDMPGFGVSLTPEDVRDVSAHVAEVLAQ